MQDYHDSIRETLTGICNSSEYTKPLSRTGLGKLSGQRLEKYLQNSHRRLNYVEARFKEFGYGVEETEFDYRGYKGINTIFRKSPESNDKIWIIAHHDYCAGLGAEDNASALAVMLEVAKYFSNHGTGQNVAFASFDLEEAQLQGSTNYVKELPKNDLEKMKCVVALECLGSGKDIVICKSVYGAKSDEGLVEKIHKSAGSLGYRFVKEDFDFFWSDHVPFARRGVKTVEICSINRSTYRERGGSFSKNRKDSVAHTANDMPESVDIENLTKVFRTLVRLAEDMQ